MNALSLLLPNFNQWALIGPVIAMFGIASLLLSKLFDIKKIKTFLQFAGALLLLIGIIYWVLVSFVQDLFADYRIIAVAAAVVMLSIIAFVVLRRKEETSKK